MRKRPPSIDGLTASTLQLPPGPWLSVLDGLCETPYRVGLEVHYYREVPDELPIPFDEVVLHADADLLVADKPHFLPVTPAGAHVHETLLGRLIRRTGNPSLAPLHRIARDTAGLV